MSITHIFIIFLLLLAAFGITALFYRPRKDDWRLYVLRSLAFFFLFLFLYNPVYRKVTTETKKTPLFLLADRSASLEKSFPRLDSLIALLRQNSDLKRRFRIKLRYFDTIAYDKKPLGAGNETDIGRVLSEIKWKKSGEGNLPVVLLTDGLSTKGKDYRYVLQKFDKIQVFPVAIGDTSRFPDLKIDRIDYNRNVGKDNIFPVKIHVSVTDLNGPVSTELIVKHGKQVVFRKPLRLDNRKDFARISTKFTASQTGWQTYTFVLKPLQGEKNRRNNIRKIFIRVDKQTAHIMILAGVVHPDIGVLKRVLSANKDYRISIERGIPDRGKTFDLIIAVQPDENQIIYLEKRREPVWFITGIRTDWAVLNGHQGLFEKQRLSPGLTEQYRPYMPGKFTLFSLPPFDENLFPPLQDAYGETVLKTGGKVLFNAVVENIRTKQPLMVFFDDKYKAVLFGQGLWRWYLYENEKRGKAVFTTALIKKTAAFLMQKPDKDLLVVRYAGTYYAGRPVQLEIQAFNKLHEFNKRAKLQLILTDARGKSKTYIPVYSDGNFTLRIPSLKSGEYRFKLVYEDFHLSKQGKFQVEDFSPEKLDQPVQTGMLRALAGNTGGKFYYDSQIQALLTDLLKDKRYAPRLVSHTTEVHLTDRFWWLLLAVLLLSIEWFYRKLRGMI